MDEQNFISTTPRLGTSQNYGLLRSEGLRLIERLGHHLWTDYNIHDPGITILELCCYVLTDLSYRTAYPVGDLLALESDLLPGIPSTDPKTLGQFHTARQILTSAAVSFDDLRKLLLDIPGVRNAWIEKHEEIRYILDSASKRLRAASKGGEGNPVNGLFDVFIEYESYLKPDTGEDESENPPIVPDRVRAQREELRQRVLDCLHRCRNLCEDFVNVCELKEEEIALCTELEVVPDADLDLLSAEIYFRLGRYVSPTVRFYTIDQLRARGRSFEEIFEGPPLEHGFIDAVEFQSLKRRCELRTSDIMHLLMDIRDKSGRALVTAVKSLSLLSFVDGSLRIQEPWVLELFDPGRRSPTFSPDRSKVLFYKNDLPYYANRGRAKTLHQEKQSAELQRRLKGHQLDLPIPLGEPRGVAEYYPAQNDLPVLYAVGRLRLPDSESPLRKAQAKQLKAYLMLFEQILANHLAQLHHLRDLFSWEETADRTYFSQVLTDLADLEEIYPAEFSTGVNGRLTLDPSRVLTRLDELSETPETARERKLHFLEHLGARFAEDATGYELLMHSMLGREAPVKLLDGLRALLRDYPASSRERGQAHDYRHPENPENLAGYQHRVYRLLGIEEMSRRRFAGERFSIEPCNGAWCFQLLGPGGAALFTSISCSERSSIEALLDYALRIGGDEANYAETDDHSAYELMRRCAEDAETEPIGRTSSKEVLKEVAEYFARVSRAEGFHVIEHVLLRARRTTDPFLSVQMNGPGESECPEVEDPYSFRMSVLLPSWPIRFRDLRFRRFVEDTLRAEAPAHVFPRICWLSHEQMNELETHYGTWEDRLKALCPRLGGCRHPGMPAADWPPSGQAPLRDPLPEEDGYAEALEHLMDILGRLVTVYPLARLHDCQNADSNEPQISLNRTSLGSF